MQIAIIGLGRMGKNICLNLLDQEGRVVAYNRSRDDVDEMVAKGAIGAYSLTEMVQKLTDVPKIITMFVPAGAPVDEILFGARGGGGQPEKDQLREQVASGLAALLPPGSIIIDGGNSFYQDSQRRFRLLQSKNIHFLDMGTSGGLEGARGGACLMVGGDESVYKQVEPVLLKIATKDGLGYFGPSGAGHFVKMIHNAIEYGMMGAIAEGFNLAYSFQPSADRSYKIDLAKLANVWAHGSIVSGLLMDKAAKVFTKDPKLESLAGEVPRGETEGEMEWLENLRLPMEVISAARKQRVATRTNPSFTGKVIAALRREFGGHAVREKRSGD